MLILIGFRTDSDALTVVFIALQRSILEVRMPKPSDGIINKGPMSLRLALRELEPSVNRSISSLQRSTTSVSDTLLNVRGREKVSDAVSSRQIPASPDRPRPTFSVVTVTYGRDHIVPRVIARIRQVIGERTDVEYVLVDNNPDAIDRSAMLADLPRRTYVKLGANKGVAARNDGALAATGDFLVFVDDDAFLHPDDAFARYESVFAGNARLAIVSARHVDEATGNTPRASFPHTDKSLPKDVRLKTFRFQGNGFAMRRSAFETVGPMSSDFFYGLEEIDYAYRVVEAGFELLYEPAVWVVEHNDPGGRRPRREVEEMRLTNKMIISWKFMPALFLPLNIAAFSAYVFLLNRGRLNPLRSFWNFGRWVRANPDRRRPIGRDAQAYIRACGGQVWK